MAADDPRRTEPARGARPMGGWRRGQGNSTCGRSCPRFLGKPEADVDTADVERLFDAMTEREAPDREAGAHHRRCGATAPGRHRLSAPAGERGDRAHAAGPLRRRSVVLGHCRPGGPGRLHGPDRGSVRTRGAAPGGGRRAATRRGSPEDAPTCATPEHDIAEPAHRPTRWSRWCFLRVATGASRRWRGLRGGGGRLPRRGGIRAGLCRLHRFWATGRSGVAAPAPLRRIRRLRRDRPSVAAATRRRSRNSTGPPRRSAVRPQPAPPVPKSPCCRARRAMACSAAAGAQAGSVQRLRHPFDTGHLAVPTGNRRRRWLAARGSRRAPAVNRSLRGARRRSKLAAGRGTAVAGVALPGWRTLGRCAPRMKWRRMP